MVSKDYSELGCPYCSEWMPTVELKLLHIENRHPKDGEKKPEVAQFRWDVMTGEVHAVASSHHEHAPKEAQGDLLLWGDEQVRLADWNASS
jgi:hypothetical protein